MHDGRVVRLLAEGRLANLAAAEGHLSAVMDMSFSNQVLCAIYMKEQHHSQANDVHNVSPEIDREIAQLKLAAMGHVIDQLANEQESYLSSRQEGI